MRSALGQQRRVEKYRRRVDCGQLDPGAVIRPVPEEWHPRMPQRLDEEPGAGILRRRHGRGDHHRAIPHPLALRGATLNSENLNLVVSPEVAETYAAHWRQRLSAAVPFTGRGAWCRQHVAGSSL
jgi:hypothetical protein